MCYLLLPKYICIYICVCVCVCVRVREREREFQSHMCFNDGSESKETACNVGHLGLTPGLGRYPGKGNGYLLHYTCLENSMDRGAWRLQSMGSKGVGHD